MKKMSKLKPPRSRDDLCENICKVFWCASLCVTSNSRFHESKELLQAKESAQGERERPVSLLSRCAKV